MYSKLQDGSFIVCGYVPSDAKNTPTQNGGTFSRFSVKVGEDATTPPDENGRQPARWVSCQSFSNTAAGIKKGDTVLAVGKIETSTFEGKTYKNLVCEFIQIQGVMPAAQPPAPAKTAKPARAAETDTINLEEFEEILSDGGVPF